MVRSGWLAGYNLGLFESVFFKVDPPKKLCFPFGFPLPPKRVPSKRDRPICCLNGRDPDSAHFLPCLRLNRPSCRIWISACRRKQGQQMPWPSQGRFCQLWLCLGFGRGRLVCHRSRSHVLHEPWSLASLGILSWFSFWLPFKLTKKGGTRKKTPTNGVPTKKHQNGVSPQKRTDPHCGRINTRY